MNIYVMGWYGHGNLGDEAFAVAFQEIFPDLTFTFGSSLKGFDRSKHDALWIGGGDLFSTEGYLDIPLDVPLAVIGVGFGNVTPRLKKVLDAAKIVVVRDQKSKSAYPKAILCHDLVFGRNLTILPVRQKRVLFLANEFFAPKRTSPNWSQAFYHAYTNEVCNVLEKYVKDGYDVTFAPMCTGAVDDTRAAAHIISLMPNPSKVTALGEQTEESLLNLIATSELVVTLRLHGLVYSTITDTPCVAICGHSKMITLANAVGTATVDYYGFSEKMFFSSLRKAKPENSTYRQKAYQEWLVTSDLIREKFNLSPRNHLLGKVS